MSIRITLEIGHEAAIRTKRTPEGFTHDWEVFVRGCDNANIHYYVDKVVFHLHETFQKPKRVVKEPPYSVKESGYAGFTLPIEIHLRNKDEPKKITFNYDLNLQQTGPAICNLQKEKFVFNNVSEEFRHKLLKGGGVIVNSSNSNDDLNHDKSSHNDDKIQLISKPKLSAGEIPRKYKPKTEEPRISNSFQDLFGTPITKTTPKVLTEPKPARDDSKNSTSSSKHEKDKEKAKKHSSHKSKDRDKSKEKSSKVESEKKSKADKNKEIDKREKREKDEKSREKREKREKSPRPRSSSPKQSSPKTPPSPTVVKQGQDDKKGTMNKDKERGRTEKGADQKLANSESGKKKDNNNFEKKNKEKLIASKGGSDSKENKMINKEKSTIIENVKKDVFIAPQMKPEKKEKMSKEIVVKDPPKTPTISEPIEDLIKRDKIESKTEEKKHKHKKKDKDKKEKEKKRESKMKTTYKQPEEPPPSINTSINQSTSTTEINKDMITMIANDEEQRSNKLKSSNVKKQQEVNSSDSSVSSPISVHDEPLLLLPPPPPQLLPPLPPPPSHEPDVNSKPEIAPVVVSKQHRKEKKEKKSKESKKLKRKSDVKIENEPVEKIKKDETKNETTTQSQQKEDGNKHVNKETEEETIKSGESVKKVQQQQQQQEEEGVREKETSREDEDAVEDGEENREAYMNRLKHLQQRIMTLEDNDELQKVVELIAKTGKYEVSARTFDFDLCLLERSTIRKLQEFFDI